MRTLSSTSAGVRHPTTTVLTPGRESTYPMASSSREFVRTQQRPLGIDLHPDHPHPPLGGVRKGGRDEGQTVHIGRVQRQERGVKGETPHRLLENRRVMMTRHPEKPHQALRPGLHQGLERPARAKNALQVAPGTEVMQLPEIELGCPQARPEMPEDIRVPLQ